MGQVSNSLSLGRITCLLCILQSVATVTSQSPPIPTIKVIHRDKNNFVQVAENATLGFVLFQLEVAVGSNLRIESKSPYVNVNVVNTTTDRMIVNVNLAQKLDYDGELKSAKLIFQYGNSNYQGLIFPVDLYVTNVNDEVPVFLNQPYLITVPENSLQGTQLYTKIQAHDRDENDKLDYFLEAKGSDVDEDYQTKFIISQDDATITLNGSLDYESNRFYQYSVNVTDSVHVVSTDVFITVLDIQDTPPEFTGAPFHATVAENANPKTSLLTIKAEDGDRGAPNSIMFRIVTGSETCPGLFEVDTHSGEITSKSVLDRDDGDVFNNSGVCSLTIEAMEGSEHAQGSNTSRSTSQTNVTITITDVDDNIPQFSASNFSATLDENTQQGVPITTSTSISVNDKDQANNAKFEVKVTNLPNIFEISPAIVQTTSEILIRVKNSTYLDYEQRQSIQVEIEAKSVNAASNSKSSKADIVIKLKNINDNSPVFRNISTSVSVEEMKQNFKIMTIIATDNDRNDDGQNFGTVTYSLDGLDQNFELNNKTGELKVKADANLDRETQDLYYLTIIAEDGGHNKVITQVNIKIIDVNDCSPSFVTDDYQTSLQENSTTFSRSLKLHATDNDEKGKANSEIEYFILSSIPSGLHLFFSIHPTSGDLTVVGALDYENKFSLGQDGKIVLTVMAKDKGSPPLKSTVDAIVMLQDINDNHPICASIFNLKVPENEKKSSVLDTVVGRDKDGTSPNNMIIYSIDQQNAEKFIIDSNTGNISLRSDLDREIKDYYDITVTVNDLGLPSLTGQCHVTINVTDINDTPPSFHMPTKSVTIKENEPIQFINVTANDEDLHHKLKFGIDWSKSTATSLKGQQTAVNTGWIAINSLNGSIQVQSLDRENVTHFSLTLTVEDEASQNGLQQDTILLTIIVEDVNDNSPTFTRSSYQAKIQENMPDGSEIHTDYLLTVQDLDEGENSEFSVSLMNYNESFTIAPLNGKGIESVILSIKNSSILDFERVQELKIKLLVTETKTKQKYSGTTTVTLSLINKNDNMPYFIEAPFTASINENMPVGTNVTTVTAKDDDKEPFGVLSYSFQTPSVQFSIDNTTGAVFTKKVLDRESQGSYTLTVYVEDVDHFGTMTQLTINVQDINDELPIFPQTVYNTSIPENQLSFIPPFIVQAFDKDEVGTKNSEINYSINQTIPNLHYQFHINNVSGEITLTSVLDFEALDQKYNGRILVVVVAKDQSSPFHSTTVTATINVIDVNDEVPKFGNSEYTVQQPENILIGSSVIQVQANDKDKSENNNKVSYMIDALSANTFNINNRTGTITTKNKLDREQNDHYNIIVTGLDNGQPTQTSSVTVSIIVLDVNDSPPQFTMESATIEVTENLSKDIYTLKATDADTNCNLSYSILWSSSSGVNGVGQYVDGNYLQNYIDINNSTGTVYPKHNLDREALQRLQLTLLVEDLNGLPDTLQNDTAILTVVVRDVNDNPPKFVGASEFLATIQENMPNGSELKFVNISALTIDDPDGEGNNNYTISMNGSTAFRISPTQGAGKVSCIVTVADSRLLDFEKQQFFTLLVTATDNQNKSMNSKINITVQVMNENDNIPQFVNAPYKGKILEGSKENTSVTSVISIYANDSDLGEFGQVKYSLKDDNKRFAIDENSGLVYSLVNNLDREAAPSYTVTVIATDKGNFTAMSQLTIYLEDVDDNSPAFTQSEYNMEISEGSDKFDTGFIVHAVDKDEPNNANSDVKYFLLDEGQQFYSNFKINETSGEVGIKVKLDFEVIPGGNISLTVMAKDQGTNHLNTTSKITVKVTDINDNAPKFYNNTYKFNISENANVGDIVGQVNSSDADLSPTNNHVTYVIDALNANKFVIDTKGIIKVNEKLDREQNGLYNITVTALDNGHPTQSSSVTVTVNLLDVNDSPPQFTWKTKTISVKENCGRLLASNKAVDLDENPSLIYSILWDESSGIDGDGQYIDGDGLKNYINVGRTTSDFYPNPTLDREATQRFQLMLLVNDTNAIGSPQNDTALLTVIVEDEDDNFPNFVGGNSFQASIQENMPAGTEVKLTNFSVLTIDDPDAAGNNRYNLSLEGSSAFTITPSLGEGKTVCVITVAEADLIDFETTQSFQLKVTATGHSSTKNESHSAYVFIQVLNENDNIPEFIGSPFHASIAENSTFNTSIITINATDRDSGYFGKLSFSIKDDSNKFGINSFTGEVYSIVSGFDREVTSSYIMTITVRDGGNFTATTQLTINMADINDETPIFTKTNYEVNIDENKKEFFPGFFVQAFDKDEKNTPNSYITYSLLNAEKFPKSNFVINETTGELYLNDCLDYETLNQTYRGGIVLIVEAKDQGKPPRSSTATITVTVGDVNDYPPQFISSNGPFNIFENVTYGFKVAQIQAKDNDASASNNKVSYMIDILSANTFRIDNTTGNITVINHLDREQIGQYNIVVTALDNGNPPLTSTVTVTVSLLDVNDSPPQFTWDTRTVNSRENVKSIIAVDEATDLDLNKDLLYTIVWSESSGIDGVGRFANGSKLQKYIGINTTTGEIFATENLDREAIQRFQLTLMVEDIAAEGQKQNDTAILTVIIEDSNDNAPTFLNGNNFTARIRENMPVGSEVKFQNVAALIINDADDGINSMYTIYLVDNTVFTISPLQGEEQTPCVISVANSSLLDFEKNESFTIEVVVSEHLTSEHYNATASITIFLDNENDNFPSFKEPSMDISVPEDSKLGYSVTTVQATDADTGEFGRVYYSIDGDQKRFIINKNTGEITLNSTDLDWETIKAYSLTVRATDSGHFDSSLQLNIKVTDVNDQSPIFKTDFSAVVDEKSLSFHSPLFVKADDADEPGTNNSQIIYFITQTPSQLGSNSVFHIDNISGEISMSKSLDFEELFRKNASNEILQLEITAKDQGLPQLNGSTIVKVIVKDVNDIAPNFTNASYKFTVKENSPQDCSVGTVKAIDLDGTSPNNELYYVIQSGGQDKFQMNSSTGEISVGVGANLDKEGKQTYNLIVAAIDRGSPAMSSSATVLVTVTDVNDSPPVFNSSHLKQAYFIPENATIGTEILTAVATDPDSDFELRFSLQWESSRAFDEKDRELNNISIVEQWMDINKTTGVVFINSQLDRETAEQIVLRITVEDIKAEKQSTQIATATVTINLEDVNDEAPEILYTDSQKSLTVSEGTKIYTEVTTLTAIDKDKDQTVTFSLIDSVYFNISQSGKLTISKQLDRETVDKLNFIVVATDNGSPPLSSNITFWVTVLDINDNDPEFSSNQTTFTVEENSPNSTFITKINATDQDEGPNANITFEFKDISPFRIDQITGNIYVSENLDREYKSSYTLTVFATDNPLLEQRRRSSIVIQLDVADTNDNAPFFGLSNYSARISEISKQNDLVLISPEPISAKDLDVGQNANVTFSLESDNLSGKDFFKIDPRSGQVSVNIVNLRDKPEVYSYVVKANDQGKPPKSATANLKVTILDENIHPPIFVSKGPIPAIPECARTEFPVYQFNATDADKDKSTNGLVNYYLENGTGTQDWEKFKLDPKTGWLRVAARLDADENGLLKIQIRAVDFGIPKLEEKTEILEILVNDINDNPPEFIQEQTKEFSVKEESNKIEIGRVRATDKDRGSIINYVIDDPDNTWKDYFLITTDSNSKEGVIQVVKPFDHETVSNVQLTLRAVDISSISKLDACDDVSSIDNRKSSPLKITVNIFDIDDNPPVFIERALSKGFLSRTEPNKIILNLKDYVTDNDTEVNSVHRFYQLGDLQADEQLSLGWSPKIKADPILVGINGTITTNFKFPEDQYGVLTFRVLVNDSGGNDTLNLKIYVVGDTQVVHMSFFNTEEELRHFQLQVTEQLSEQGYRFVPDDIMPFYDEKGTVDGTKSVLVIHAVEESTGKIIDGASLLSKLDSKDKINILNQYKIIKSEIGDKASRKSVNSPDDRTQYILIGVIIVIAITFIITLYMLIHNIQRFKRKLKAATIDVYGMDPVKFPGLDNNNIKDQNPIFMRDDLVIDESMSDGNSDSYSQTSENSIDKNAMNDGNHGIDEQEVTLNLYGADGQYFNDASDLPNAMRYIHNVIEGEAEEENLGELVGRKVARGFPPEYDSDEDNVFSFSTSNFESTEI